MPVRIGSCCRGLLLYVLMGASQGDSVLRSYLQAVHTTQHLGTTGFGVRAKLVQELLLRGDSTLLLRMMSSPCVQLSPARHRCCAAAGEQSDRSSGIPAVAVDALIPPAPVVAPTAAGVGAVCCQEPACLLLFSLRLRLLLLAVCSCCRLL